MLVILAILIFSAALFISTVLFLDSFEQEKLAAPQQIKLATLMAWSIGWIILLCIAAAEYF